MATRIYVGNLPYTVGNEQLAQVFFMVFQPERCSLRADDTKKWWL